MSQPGDPRDRASVVSDLANADEDVRRFAVERVALLPPDEALPLLAAQLGDSSWRVRKAVVERIVASSDVEQATRALIDALADGENPGRRNSAVEALVEAGPRMLPALLDAARSADVDVRKFAIDALAGIGDAGAGPGLLAALGDPDPNVRGAAAEALAAVPAQAAPQALLARATDGAEELSVRFAALRALESLRHPVHSGDLVGVLDDPMLGGAGFALLGRRDGDAGAARTLLKGLHARSHSHREAAMSGLLRALAHCDASESDDLVRRIREAVPADDPLIAEATERLGEAGAETRLMLLQFLGLLEVEAIVVPILRCARDELLAQAAIDTLAMLGGTAERAFDAAWDGLDAAARRDACTVLGLISGESGRERLVEALRDVEPEVRFAAAASVARRRAAGALPTLLDRLEDLSAAAESGGEDEALALIAAVVGVAEPRPGAEPVHGRALTRLRAWLERPDENLRLAAGMILGGIGRPQDADLITLLLKDPSARVRRAAVDALARLEPGAAAGPLRLALVDEEPRVRMAAVVALGASEDDSAVGDLGQLAQDPDRWVRAAAVRALGIRFGARGLGEHRATVLAVLERALDDDVLVAIGAVEAFAEIGGNDALRVAALLERSEPELLKEAVLCFERHAPVAQLQALIPLVGHVEWSVRAEAIRVLGQRGVTRAVPAILSRLEAERDDFVREIVLSALGRLGA